MGTRNAVAIALVSSVLAAGPSVAATRCVPLSHPGSCDQHYATIQAAVDAASPADVVLVAAGTYAEAVTINGSVTLRGAQAGVDARSRSGPETILTHSLGPITIVDCDNSVVVDGFTLSGATDVGGSWGGAWITLGGCGADGTFRIENNVIRDNIAGMYLDSGNVTVLKNRVLSNTAMPGSSEAISAGVQLRSLVLEQNLFEGHLDGSVEVSGPASLSIRDNRFDRRIRLTRTSFALIQHNSATGTGSPDALIELAGGNQSTTIFDNEFAVAPSGTAIAVSDAASTGVPNSGIYVNRNCFAPAGSVGLTVQPGSHAGTINATSNWWGAVSGPSGIGPGSGAAIVAPPGVVQFVPFRATSEACGCLAQPDGTPCDDTNVCTVSDVCSAGVCTGALIHCDDGQLCTQDLCDPVGGCVFSPVTCDDGSLCTTDSCDPATGCVYTNAPCANPCFTCNPQSGCVDTGCTDGTACTADHCEAGVGCVHVPNHSMCAFSGAPCIESTCVSGVGCVNVADDSNTCDFGFCFDWHCSNGQCVSGPWPCDDHDPCTSDGCDQSSNRCVNNSLCPGGCAYCQAGVGCVQFTCPDSNPCTRDYCLPTAPNQGQCYHDPIAGTACDDGSSCTTGDQCTASTQCVGSPVAAPAEVNASLRMSASGGGAVITWDPQAGPGESYDLLRGTLAELPVGVLNGSAAEACLLDDVGVVSAVDNASPAVGSGFWYLVRKDSGCAGGSYGWAEHLGVPVVERISATCP